MFCNVQCHVKTGQCHVKIRKCKSLRIQGYWSNIYPFIYFMILLEKLNLYILCITITYIIRHGGFSLKKRFYIPGDVTVDKKEQLYIVYLILQSINQQYVLHCPM